MPLPKQHVPLSLFKTMISDAIFARSMTLLEAEHDEARVYF
jgi:hypothetical protein